jgi:hypothetical protein
MDRAAGKLLVYAANFELPYGRSEAWSWDGTVCTAISSAQRPAPSPRTGVQSVWDDERKQVVFFGGVELGGAAMFFRYPDGAWTWKNGVIADIGGPPGRTGAAMGWDPERKAVVVTGGVTSSGTMPPITTMWFKDTWVYNAQGWSQQPSSNLLGDRSGDSLAWDAVRRELVLVGESGSRSWNGTTWSAPTALASQGLPRGHSALALGTQNSILYNAHSESHMWNGTQWLRVGNPLSARSRHAAAWDPVRKQIVVYGGQQNAGAQLNDTQLWTGGGFQSAPAGSDPRSSHTMAWDQMTQTILRGGGQNDNDPNTLWSWKGTGWVQLPSANTSLGKISITFDPERNRTVFFNGEWSGVTPLIWNGTALSNPSIGVAGVGRYHSATWDDSNKNIVLFGGNCNGNGYCAGTQLWNGQNLVSAPAQATPTPQARVGHATVYDPLRKVVVMFGGEGVNNVRLADTWLWTGSQWVLQRPQQSPPARSHFTMQWDPVRQAVLLFGGRLASGVAGDAWLWDGTSWYELADRDDAGPQGRQDHTLTYDPERRRSLLAGGSSNYRDVTGTTWLLYLRGGSCMQDADCGSGHCTDGVCCESAKCGACETCSGANPGKCTPVTLAEDPDTCAYKDQVSCDSGGRCIKSLGATCTKNSDCAPGYCADGVCCDSPCDGACRSCKGADKIDPVDGRCGPTRMGTNPGGRCTAGAICGSQGACETTKAATCKDVATAIDGAGVETKCGAYQCRTGRCLDACQSIDQCNAPFVCASGTCVALSPPAPVTDGCCAATPQNSGGPIDALAPLAAVVLVATRLRRRPRQRATDER